VARLLILFGALVALLNAVTETPSGKLWTELANKRRILPGIHQEFEVSQTFKTATGTQSSKRQIVVDMSQGKWRERSVSGSGDRIRIFDGNELFTLDEGGDEFVRTRRRGKGEDPLPSPYGSADPDWSKAAELERKPCGLRGHDDMCVTLEVPLKSLMSAEAGRMRRGSERVFVDLETGLVLAVRTVQTVQTRTSGYQSELAYTLKVMTQGAPADAQLFQLAAQGMREVKELSPWNAARIKKSLAGKLAPELAVSDIQGNPVTLSAFQGKIVLLDFWTTWCPPCRADGPALDKLYRKYGAKDLMIVGVSVSEDRAVVESYLKGHPHEYPIVLTTENEMPRPYQIAAFPTYIVIDKEGAVTSAAEGEQGFSELRQLLKKAGIEVE
jgi:thiol-disulfide isomerase/thioredoxin